MKIPKVPMSWGELFDKITILQIKKINIKSKIALKNINNELDQLYKIFNDNFSENIIAKKLMSDLTLVNKKLWNIEDEIREKENNKIFDIEFIELARSVYFTNDNRARIKRKINKVFISDIIEEKSYRNYT